MRTTSRLNIAAAVACAALTVGCARGDKGEDRAANDAVSSPETVSLTGCVQVAPGSANEFALSSVRVAPLGEQPSDALTYSSNRAITEGSWVRLAMAEDDRLRQHVGQRVTIVGSMRDDGGDTIGTSGVRPGPQEPEPGVDRSQAAAGQHHSEKKRDEAGPIGHDTMSNSTAPQIVVQRIEGTGEPCHGDLKPENRR